MQKKYKIVIAILVALVVLAAAGMLTHWVVQVKVPAMTYRNAEKLIAEGKQLEALRVFRSLDDYSDAKLRSRYLSGACNTLSASMLQTMAVNEDGTVSYTGYTDYIRYDISKWTDVIAVSSSSYNSVALKGDGTVVSIGSFVGNYEYYGQCDVKDWTNIVAISAGDTHTLGLKEDGTVVYTPLQTENMTADLAVYWRDHAELIKWTDIVSVSAGFSHDVGLKSDGTVIAIGNNEFGQCNISKWKDVVAISAGAAHTVGLRSDGTVLAVGYNHADACGGVYAWKDIVAISAGSNHTVALKADGTVVATGLNNVGQCEVSGWRDIVAISAGSVHTAGLKADGTVVIAGEIDERSRVSDWKNVKNPWN